MVVLVTGANGFLGRHAVAALEAADTVVIPAGRPDVIVPSPELDRLLTETQPNAVLHCAGPASVPASLVDPERDRVGSVCVTAGLLDSLARQKTPPKLVLVSSAAVYGQPERLPVAETDAPRPISPYGRHRLEVEQLALHSGVPTVVARVFSAYGEGLERQVLWDIATKAVVGEHVELWGTGTESRDFVHADDVGSALALLCADDGLGYEIINIGSGTETTIAELAQRLLTELGASDAVSFRGVERGGDPLRWQASIARLRSLGWTPSVSLADGIARYASWVRERLR